MGVAYFIRKKKDDYAAIHTSINLAGINRFTLPMPLANIKVKDWDNGWIKTGKGKQMNSYLENDLIDFKFRVENFYKEYIKVKQKTPSKEVLIGFIKSNKDLNEYFEKQKVFPVIPLFKEILKRRREGDELYRGRVYNNDTLKNYDSTILRLEHYAKYTKTEMTNLDVIDKKYILGFEAYLLKHHNYMTNSAGCKMKTLKLFLEVLHNDDKIPYNPYKKYSIEISKEKSVNIALEEQELTDLENLDLSFNKDWDLIRDQFLILCWTGLRISDFKAFARIPKEGEIITFHNIKTGEEVNIPIFPTVGKILCKYNGIMDRIIHTNILNKEIKNIGKLVPGLCRHIEKQYTKGGKVVKELVQRHTMLCSHVGRRTLASNLATMGVPYHEIMILTGHRSLRTFEVYLKSNKREVLKKMVEKVSASQMGQLHLN